MEFLINIKRTQSVCFVMRFWRLPSDSGSFAIKESDVYKWCGDFDMINSDNVPSGYKSTDQIAGIDWAWNNKDGTDSHTIITIATRTADKIKILYAKRFDGPRYHDPDVVLNEMFKLVNAFYVKIIATDYAIGHKENFRFKNRVNATVVEFESTRSHSKMKWNHDTNSYHIGRTPTMSYTFEKIRTGFFEFPKIDKFKPYAQDILNIFCEMDPNTGILTYDHEGPDDFFQTLNLILHSYERLNSH